MNDEDRRLRAASWRREQQHWPWFGDWPQIEKATIKEMLKGRLPEYDHYPAFSWFPRGSVIELPKIPDDYEWQRSTRLAVPKIASPTCGWRRCCSAFEWNLIPWDYPATTKEDWKAWHIQNNVEGPYIPEERHDHNPLVKQRLSTDKIDQRLEVFLLSQDFIEEISEDYFGKYRMPKISKLLDKYNETLDNNDLVNYDLITRDQMRDAYERRFEERIKAKINKDIKNILDKILKPEKQYQIRSRAEIHDNLIHYDWITEEYNPGHFFYKGTERIRQECSFEEDYRLFKKGLDYYRAKRAKQSIAEVPIHQIRTYEVSGEIKRIMLSLSLDRFYISGDKLNERFKNFFLSEAIRTKRINDTPEDKQRFLFLFGLNNRLTDASFYDPTPYIPKDELKERKKYWFSVGA